MFVTINNTTGGRNDFALLSKRDFIMIKYPRRRKYSIPHERVFKMDYENLVCIIHA